MGYWAAHWLALLVHECKRQQHEGKSLLWQYFLLCWFHLWQKWCGLFHSGAILGTFSAHLTAAQGAKQIPDIEVNGVKPAFSQAYGALALSAAGVSLFITFLVCKNFYPCTVQVQRALLLYSTETITWRTFSSLARHPRYQRLSTKLPGNSQPEWLASMTYLWAKSLVSYSS